MIFKTSFTIGFLPDGSPELIAMGDADKCKAAFIAERETRLVNTAALAFTESHLIGSAPT